MISIETGYKSINTTNIIFKSRKVSIDVVFWTSKNSSNLSLIFLEHSFLQQMHQYHGNLYVTSEFLCWRFCYWIYWMNVTRFSNNWFFSEVSDLLTSFCSIFDNSKMQNFVQNLWLLSQLRSIFMKAAWAKVSLL